VACAFLNFTWQLEAIETTIGKRVLLRLLEIRDYKRPLETTETIRDYRLQRL